MGVGIRQSKRNAYISILASSCCCNYIYCHKGSFFHPRGKPMALVSMDGLADNNASILSFISLFGEMMFRKYLMMQRSK